MSEDEFGLGDHELAAFEAGEPPTEFADRVMNALSESALSEREGVDDRSDDEEPAQRAATYKRRYVAALGIAVAIAAAVVVTLWPSAKEGSFASEGREEITFGRAVLVAEEGASGSWRSEGKSVRVEQNAGNVFYRVEKGGPFVVETPAGSITVRGTCFRVEVSEMRVARQTIAGAVVAASITAVAIVSVYEGRVAVANEHGELELEAGEATAMRQGERPEDAQELSPEELSARRSLLNEAGAAIGDLTPSNQLDLPALREQHDVLLRRTQEQAEEVARLQSQVREMEVAAGVDERLFYPTSSEDLQLLAERCEIRADHPPVMSIEPGDVGRETETLGLSTAEAEIVQDAINRLHRSFRTELRELYVEATGDAANSSSLSPEALLAELQDKATPLEGTSLQARIANERAGLSPVTPEEEQQPAERAFRRFASLGDEFQALLAQSLGAERADELRRVDSGWPWSHSRIRGCGDR